MDKLSRRDFLKTSALTGAGLVACVAVGSLPALAADGLPLNERPEAAASKFGAMSCAEALAETYADLVGLSADQGRKVAAGFGLGMGRKQTCGAVTVMLMIAGLAGQKKSCPSLMEAFEKESGSLQCAYFVDSHGYSRCRDLLRTASGLLNAQIFV
ncbi:hypothetical protein C4J81_04225 [Deltaproteobacteria bacterium Smac51]|nr:hypothetical protein C4J81_04225 [Deltaproteobacteria bacterium Smac51]